ncbi:MAG: aspartate ammonia-lyase [Methylotenera sp.]|nr:aspartate ammonia-lyase [Oligoflexia bacterium]
MTLVEKKDSTSPTRAEHDSLGSVSVPNDALYGAQTMRALDNFSISSRIAHPELIRSYLWIKLAASRANFRCGALPRKHSELIEKAVLQLLESESTWPQNFPVDPYQAGAGTSQNMNLNEVIANLANQLDGVALGIYAPVHPNDHVNCSQSTNDTFPTAMRLSLLIAAKALTQEVELLSKSFKAKANLWMKIPKSARTHLQDAVPMTLGQEFSGYADALSRCGNWLESGRNSLRDLGIGGSAAGTGLNVPENYSELIVEELSRLSGESLRTSENPFESMQSQAPVSFYSSTLRVLCLELTRICNDLRLLASGPFTGLSELILPAVQPGSSIMPGKVNPSILEMANQTWYSVLGMDQTIAMCVQAGQLELNVMMPMMAYSGLEATRVCTRALSTLRERCIDGLEPNLPRLQKYFESTPQIATALSPRLGYEKTAEIVKKSILTGESIVDLCRREKLLTEEELTTLLDLDHLTHLNRTRR